MKKIVLIPMVLLCLVLAANAQNLTINTASNCKLAKIMTSPESTIQKDFRKIKKIKSLLFEAVMVTNLNTTFTESGLRISGNTGRNFAPTMSAYIDEDELDDFLNAIDHMLSKTITIQAPQNTVEYKYQSRGGFCIKAFNAKRLLSSSKRWYVSLKLMEDVAQSDFLFDTDDLYDIKNAAEQAKATLTRRVLTAK
ncbi:MAG: hypothetical protein EOP46_16875 [Sphingobacteriaceae bacterium]|nr:MAG: hypothetical protein EOP46_16875 [Sphingobacteriaceae bacterium]